MATTDPADALLAQADALEAQARALRALAESMRARGTTSAPPSSATPLCDKRELARLLAVSTGTVDRLVRSGLPYLPVGDARRFEPEACRAWLLEQGQRPAAPATAAPAPSGVRVLSRRR